MKAFAGTLTDRKRGWYRLAQRHRRMAERLLRAGFADGAVFHAYHAYECAISAFLASRGVPVPPHHVQRLVLFSELSDPTAPFAVLQVELGSLTVALRNESLYYDERSGRSPADRLTLAYASSMLRLVHQFASAVWREIR